ncbi:DUF429 domain-containing protein [Dehalococcoidia bacterium]|nr:DUF429 domain-containing protein [Dehalococcoidia bacterium]
MALILSIDLAYKSYEDFGFCILEEAGGKVADVQYLPYNAIGITGTPQAEAFAQSVLSFCLDHGVSILMLDGPQGWKDPDSGLPHQRVCEKHLNTQAKTGTVGKVKPTNFKSFVSFAIDVFGLLHKTGQVSLVTQPRIVMPTEGVLLVETYPYSAWRSLNIRPLPRKKKCTPEQIAQNVRELGRRLRLPETKSPTHDEVSALVGGLAGVAIAAVNSSGYIASGVPPKLISQGYLVEGYIVNPR